jgi:carboxylesterase type B
MTEIERLNRIDKIHKKLTLMWHTPPGWYISYSDEHIEKSDKLKKERASLMTDKEIIEEIVNNERKRRSSRKKEIWITLTDLEIEFASRGLINHLTSEEAELASELISNIDKVKLKAEEKERELKHILDEQKKILKDEEDARIANAQAELQRRLNKKWWEFWI